MSHTRFLLEDLYYRIAKNLSDSSARATMNDATVGQIGAEILSILKYEAGEDNVVVENLRSIADQTGQYGRLFEDLRQQQFTTLGDHENDAINLYVHELQIWADRAVITKDQYEARRDALTKARQQGGIAASVLPPQVLAPQDPTILPSKTILTIIDDSCKELAEMLQFKIEMEVASALSKIIADVSRSLTMKSLFAELTLGQESIARYIGGSEKFKKLDEELKRYAYEYYRGGVNRTNRVDKDAHLARMTCLYAVCDAFGLKRIASILKALDKWFANLHASIEQQPKYFRMGTPGFERYTLYCAAVNSSLLVQDIRDPSQIEFSKGSLLDPFTRTVHFEKTLTRP